MIKIELVNEESQPVLMIKTKTSLKLLPQIIGESYMKIINYLNKLNEVPAGAPYTAYYTWRGDELDVELGFPVLKTLPGDGEIKSGEVQKGTYITVMYKGPYSKMEEPYNEIFKWMDENNFDVCGAFYEYYYNSPNEVPESELLTKISVPVKQK